MKHNQCPCGSGILYKKCCEPLITGQQLAETAEQLMRSRYTANVLGAEHYLLSSWHESTRPETITMADSPQWLNLVITRVKQGTVTDKKGEVEFKATCLLRGNLQVLHENSRFVRQRGKWEYVDGVEMKNIAQGKESAGAVGRNQPCPCGSGRKYKKCCLYL